MRYSQFRECQNIAYYAKILGHPTRVFIVYELLKLNGCCNKIGDLSSKTKIAKSTFSQHLKELKKIGLVQGEIEHPRIKYCINKEKLNELNYLFKSFFDK